ncbi:MAG: thiamine pyrophosphate-dependent enzyme [Streptosporangiaceae bacterium]
MWTAAREELPVIFAVVDNTEYRILKNALRGRHDECDRPGPPGEREETFVGMDLDVPTLDFRALARSMGVAATYVERPGDVREATRAAAASGRPHLLHLRVTS